MNNESLPRNLRNNNPLNLRRTRDKWQGLSTQQQDREFCQFEDMKYGWRAAFMLLCRNYYYVHHLHTIRAIIDRWAPSHENNTSAYVDTVSRWMKYDAEAPMPLPGQGAGRWLQLGYCMACYEAGLSPQRNGRIELLPLVEGWMLYEDVARKGKFKDER